MGSPLRVSLGQLTGFRPKGCAGKIDYPTKAAAAKAMLQLMKRGKATDATRINTYECDQHAQRTWHIGHRREAE
jgi:hypothetical protein